MAGTPPFGEFDAAARAGTRRGLRWPFATLLAAALAAGIAAGQNPPFDLGESRWTFLILALISVISAAFALCQARRHRSRIALANTLLLAAMFCIGAQRTVLQQRFTAPDDLAAQLGEQAALVRLRGIALAEPVLRQRIGGALARFDYRQPSTYFPLRVDALISRHGQAQPARGEVLVRVDQVIAPLHAGDKVEAEGFLLKPGPPRNPGEFDYQEYARALGQAGFLTVASRDLLRITPAQHGSLLTAYLNWRDEFRRRASAWLLADLPPTPRTERDSLLANLLLGQREEQIDGVSDAFQHLGLAHVLAISGFHMGVLAAIVLFALRLFMGDRRWHGWFVIAFVLLYLTLVEARMPVLRAGVMTCLASLGLVFGRRVNVGGLVSISAIALLLWRPDQLFNAGFQLTFGVVLGLIYLAPILRRRMFGRPNLEASTLGEMLRQWLFAAIAATITAWMVALPITIYHFGIVTPMGMLMTIITLPLASTVLALGFVKMALAALLPSAALLVGVPLSIVTDVLLAIVLTVDRLCGQGMHVPHPSTAWSLAAGAAACWLVIGDRWLRLALRRINAGNSSAAISPLMPIAQRGFVWRRLAMAKWLLAFAMVAWLIWPVSSGAALRIDMLSVGDGSCFVIRSGNSTVVFDAGSSTDLNVARRSLIPAMRRLGVRSIDAIAITHADLDHYSATVELAEEFDVSEILITPQFQRESQSLPMGPVAFAMEQFNRQRLSISTAAAGEVRRFGQATWTWLNPQPEREYPKTNNSSMVIRIECAGHRVLMCGDIQKETMDELLQREGADALHADVVELPHHGSYHKTADDFIRQLKPRLIMQSTGWSRWHRDKWGATLRDIPRLVTARDGACWIELMPTGDIRTGRFLANTHRHAAQHD